MEIKHGLHYLRISKLYTARGGDTQILVLYTCATKKTLKNALFFFFFFFFFFEDQAWFVGFLFFVFFFPSKGQISISVMHVCNTSIPIAPWDQLVPNNLSQSGSIFAQVLNSSYKALCVTRVNCGAVCWQRGTHTAALCGLSTDPVSKVSVDLGGFKVKFTSIWSHNPTSPPHPLWLHIKVFYPHKVAYVLL